MAFLLAWVAVEAVGSLVLSPFPAARRVLGVCVPLALLAGRLAPDARAVRVPAIAGLVLAALYGAVDWADAALARRAARGAAAEHSGAYFLGRWGFAYYAAEAGLAPAWPGRTVLGPGEWLVVGSDGTEPPGELPVPADGLTLVGERAWEPPAPVRTFPGFYGGPAAVRPGGPAALVVRVYRADRTVAVPPGRNPSHNRAAAPPDPGRIPPGG